MYLNYNIITESNKNMAHVLVTKRRVNKKHINTNSNHKIFKYKKLDTDCMDWFVENSMERYSKCGQNY